MNARVPAGGRRGHRRLLRLRRRRRQPARRRAGLGGLPRLEPVGDLGGRHEPRHRRPGGYEWEAGWGTTTTDWNGSPGRRRRRATSSTAPAAGPSHVFPMPAYQAGAVPAAAATWHGAAAAGGARLAMDADPQTGVTFAQTYVEPNGRGRIIDSWIGGTSLAAPLSRASWRSPTSGAAPHGFVNPALYRLRGRRRCRRHRRPPPLAVLRNALAPDGSIVTRLRSLDRDSSLQPGRAGTRSPGSARWTCRSCCRATLDDWFHAAVMSKVQAAGLRRSLRICDHADPRWAANQAAQGRRERAYRVVWARPRTKRCDGSQPHQHPIPPPTA